MNARIRSEKAQSILELAALGGIILAIMGVFLTYGLRYNYNQQIQQQAFRRAIAEASINRPEGFPSGRATYMMIRDRHSPNPSDRFAVGEVSATSASASITKDYLMQETADTISELPYMVIDINGQIPSGIRGRGFLTAGFGDYCLSSACNQYAMRKYQEIFGPSNVWETSPGCVRVIDNCEGEIIDYDSCTSQCRMFTDVTYCSQQCLRGRSEGGGADCPAICSTVVEVPAYCDALDDIFSFVLVGNERGSMGVQQGSTSVFTQNSVQRKVGSPGVVSTTDSINWQNNVLRRIIFKPYQSLSSAEMAADSSVGEAHTVTTEAAQ